MACKSSDKRETSVKCGTPGFVDPDVLKGLPFHPKSDIFSLGVIFYNLITGFGLYFGNNSKKVLT